jgi:hypothetical protein
MAASNLKSVKKADSFGLFYRASADGVEARWESVGAMVGENITVGVVGFGYSLNETMVDSPSRWISTIAIGRNSPHRISRRFSSC